MNFKSFTKSLIASTALTAIAFTQAQAEDGTHLLRDPAISKDHIAFIYAGDLWIADKEGKSAKRLTSSASEESDPTFSPDGTKIAYTGNHENNADVYVISVNGGQPERLTFHPGDDVVLDWSANGKEVAFASDRETNHGRSDQLYHAFMDGRLPEKQMDARVFRGRYDRAQDLFAYIPYVSGYNGLFGGTSGWRGYRGGSVPAIHVMDIDANTVAVIDGKEATNFDPMFVEDNLYFLSDRNDTTINLFKFDPARETANQVSDDNVWDIRSADSYGEDIIFERGGRLFMFDTQSETEDVLDISIKPDLQQLRQQWKNASQTLQAFKISPNGKRVAVTARGDVFTVPVKDGSTRNISQTPTRDYTAIWSTDGQKLAYIDAFETTQYLIIQDQKALDDSKRIELNDNFNFLMDWSSDGEHIIFTDNKLRLHALNIETRQSDVFSEGARREDVQITLSPDGNWVAFTQEQANFNRDLYLYNLKSGQSTLLTDGMVDISSPAFSPDGQYLYFAGSTNSGPTQIGLDMSSREEPIRSAIYAAVLASDGQSPLQKALGDEEPETESDDETENGEEEKKSVLDLEGLSDRIVALPIPQDNYSDIAISKEGHLFAIRNVQAGTRIVPPGESSADYNDLIRYDFKERKMDTMMSGVMSLDMSETGEHMALLSSKRVIMTAEVSDKIDAKPLNMSDVKMKIDPREEWATIFDEVWRMQKAYFYDPNMHGLDWDAIYDRYRPLVEHAGRREDLTAILVEMIGEMQVGHNRTGGGDTHREDGTNTGLLGADLELVRGAHRITKIYSGENWNPFIDSPLAGPGIDIETGDYIISIDGHKLQETDNIFEHLQGKAGKLVTLGIASSPRGRVRDVVIEPTRSENGARLWNWIESNRKFVDEATDGRVGYVYLPNTSNAGFTLFNRMFFSQTDKDAIIFDERANGGGHAANYITDVLSRKYLASWKDSVGLTYNTPGGAMFGPKVMLVDQDAGSGGDFLPYSFREYGLGPVIGTRTWGGLIGISANPPLIDGGYVSVPNFRFIDVNYEWTVENEGVAPDIEVTLDPTLTNIGQDSQLDRAIDEIKDLLDNFEPTVPTEAPPYPTELGK